MVIVLASSAADRGFELSSGQTKDYKIGACFRLSEMTDVMMFSSNPSEFELIVIIHVIYYNKLNM
jgi:hypothetical protein